MKKVLLAIDGKTPSSKVFNYAVNLCQMSQAKLIVLQITGKQTANGYMEKIWKKAGAVKNYFENAMLAATYAEAGEPEIARELMHKALDRIQTMLSELKEAGVAYQLLLKSGEPEKVIVDYVNQHRDIMFTIYDSPYYQETDKETKRKINNMEKQLSTPLFVCNDEQAEELSITTQINCK